MGGLTFVAEREGLPPERALLRIADALTPAVPMMVPLRAAFGGRGLEVDVVVAAELLERDHVHVGEISEGAGLGSRLRDSEQMRENSAIHGPRRRIADPGEQPRLPLRDGADDGGLPVRIGGHLDDRRVDLFEPDVVRETEEAGVGHELLLADDGARLVLDQTRVRAAWAGRKNRTFGVKVFDDLLKAFREDLAERAGARASAPTYAAVDGRMCISEIGRGPRAITDGTVRIVEQLQSEHGLFVFRIEAVALDGTLLGSALVEPKELDGAEWLAKYFGAGIVLHGRPHELRAALMAIAKGTKLLVVRHTGFVTTPNGLAFLHAEGKVGAPDIEVRAELDEPLHRYVLPSSTARAREGFETALGILDIAPPRVGVVLLACVAASVLASLFPPLFVVFLVGKSQSMKTTLAHLVLSFFGTFPPRSGTIDMSATYAGIEDVLFRAKDIPAVVDDYAPGTNPSMADHYRTVADQVIRSVGNRTGKARMTAEMKRQPNRPPRGLAIMTGEEPPGTTESILARTVMVRISRDIVNAAKLAELQAKLWPLPSVALAIVERVITEQAGVEQDFKKALRAAETVAQMNAGVRRASEALVHLRASFEIVIRTALLHRAIREERAAELRAVADAVLPELLEEQSAARTETDAVERFLESLYQLWGAGDLDIRPISELAQQAHGYFDLKKNRLYLRFDIVWELLAQRRRSAGEGMGASRVEVQHRLKDQGTLLAGEKNRFTSKVGPAEKRIRVVELVLDRDRLPASARHAGLPMSFGSLAGAVPIDTPPDNDPDEVEE